MKTLLISLIACLFFLGCSKKEVAEIVEPETYTVSIYEDGKVIGKFYNVTSYETNGNTIYFVSEGNDVAWTGQYAISK